MKVLIVDDQPMILKSLHHVMERAGYETLAAVDGLQAKDFFDQEQPDLAIIDLMLPFVSGKELIEYIRDYEKNYTKIIVLSGMHMQETIEHVFELGADDFVRKPFAPSELLTRLKRLEKYSIHSLHLN